MNDKQIAFIMCVNSEIYAEECIWYINQLYIPQGYSIDIITIADAESMTAGYNAAMNSSEARYKVYIHQDTFIINKNFISDILSVFNADLSIGMLGVLGGTTLSNDGIMFDKWNVGGTYANDGEAMLDLRIMQDESKAYIDVKAIDGMIMVTQVDIPWREDVFKNWDFYDVSQSLEMLRAGKKVVVPFQQHLWCIHDCGKNNFANYYIARKDLINEYRDFFESDDNDMQQYGENELLIMADRVAKSLIDNFNSGKYDLVKTLIDSAYEKLKVNNEIMIMKLITEIMLKEGEIKFVGSNMSWQQALEKFLCVKFLIIRAMYEENRESEELINQYISSGVISKEAVVIIQYSVKIQRNYENETRLNLINKYKNSKDAEVQSIVNYLKNRIDVDTFNDDFVEKYKKLSYNIYEDTDNGMHYMMYQGKRMYLKRKMNMNEMIFYCYNITMEQDINSPHRYLDMNFDVHNGDVVIDAGVAEGNFSLDIIDRVKHIYMVECDDEWLEALHYTFEPYQDKVTIIPKMLGNIVDENSTTIDEIMSGQKVNFIKMDIEGAEESALIGGKDTIDNSDDIRCAICSYHRSDAQKNITEYMNKMGFDTSTTKGYMFFRDDEESYKNLELRRGIVRAVKY